MFIQTARNYLFLVFLGILPLRSIAQEIAIPSYFYPDSPNCSLDNNCYWEQLNEGSNVVGIAIINPNSGVGNFLDSNYRLQTQATQAKGITVLGYVDTDYTRRDIEIVKDQIDKYLNWYKIDGIFVDESSNECNDLNYYTALNNYIKSKSTNRTAITVLNPGTKTNECFINSADILVTFEDNFSDYNNEWPGLSWENKYPANRFWHLIYNTSEIDMPKAIQLSKQRNAGYVYVTNDVLENQWDMLPDKSYFNTEIGLVNPNALTINETQVLSQEPFYSHETKELSIPLLKINNGKSFQITLELIDAPDIDGAVFTMTEANEL